MLPLMRIALGKYPRLLETMARRHEVYNETSQYIRSREAAGDLLVIRPDAPLPVGRVEHDPEKLRLTYELGRSVAERRLAEIRTYLFEPH